MVEGLELVGVLMVVVVVSLWIYRYWGGNALVEVAIAFAGVGVEFGPVVSCLPLSFLIGA